MITKEEVESFRDELEEEYASIPPTEANTALWEALWEERHQQALRLHGAIQALNILIGRMK